LRPEVSNTCQIETHLRKLTFGRGAFGFIEDEMQKGFNSDVIYRGMNFHIQTEDWGRENPYLVSRVFQSGAVVKSVKTPYTDVLTRMQLRDANAIRLAMREQHQQILDLLVSGQLL
jgi:hypothetical protein